MVSFSAGKDSFHGVKAVGQGIRCALALWFTMDESHDEKVITKQVFVLCWNFVDLARWMDRLDWPYPSRIPSINHAIVCGLL